MDSFEANKIFGAVLGTVFVLFGGSLIAETIFHSEMPATPGYAIEVPEDAGGGGAEAPAAVPIAALLQDADAEAGATVFRRCQSCHSPEEGAPAGVGPHMWGVVNRPISEDPGFSYSTAMEAFSEDATVVWDYEHLNGFLRNPRQYVPGTSMGFAGISNDGDRANLIAYLRTLSHDPAPLPEPPADEPEAAAEGEDAAPAEGEEAAPATEEAAPAEDAAPAADGEEATPAAEEEVTDPAATTDPAASPQSPATTDPSADAAPVSESPTTGEATDAEAAEPNVGEEAPAEQEAPAEEAPAEEAPAPAPGGTTIVPAPQQ